MFQLHSKFGLLVAIWVALSTATRLPNSAIGFTSQGKAEFVVPRWPLLPFQPPAPTLQQVNPFNFSYVHRASLIVGLLNLPVPVSAPTDSTLYVNPSQYWVWNGTNSYQWVYPDASYILQNGVCYKVGGWTLSTQLQGYSNLVDNSQNPLEYDLNGMAYDVSSCGCALQTQFKFIKLWNSQVAPLAWNAQEPFSGITAVIAIYSNVTNTNSDTVPALSPLCINDLSPLDYCDVYGPADAAACVIAPPPA